MSNEARFRELVGELENPLIGYVRGFVKDIEVARDIVQEGFLRLWKNPDNLDDKAKAWLYVVCRNLALDRLRKLKVARNHSEKLKEEEEARIDSFVEDKQSMKQVLEVFSSLSMQEQEVLKLKFQSELSYKEISELTGISVNQVGVVIHNGVKKIRKKVAT